MRRRVGSRPHPHPHSTSIETLPPTEFELAAPPSQSPTTIDTSVSDIENTLEPGPRLGLVNPQHHQNNPFEEVQDTPVPVPAFTPTWLIIQYLPAPLDSLVISLVSLFAQLALSLHEMALGLSSLWGGQGGKVHQPDGNGPSGRERVNGAEPEKKIKRRRRKVEENGHGAVAPAEGYYPGMVNLSGTLCYMNSVLQAFASITSLVSHLEKIEALAVEADVPTPVTDSLLAVIQELNTPKSHPPPALRPTHLLAALHPLPAVRRLLSTREQQDAHELFVVLAEAISDEGVKVGVEISKLRGMGEVLSLKGYVDSKNSTAGRADKQGAEKRQKIRGIALPWEGLMARRRTCQTCGWSENVRMDTLGGMELPIPLRGDVRVESCIAEYLAPEHLTEVTCEMCSLRRTIEYYRSEVERLSAPASSAQNQLKASKKSKAQASVASGSFSTLDGLPTSFASTSDTTVDDKLTNSRKKRARDARRAETVLQEMLDSGTISHFGETSITPPAGSASSAPIAVRWQTARTNSIRQGIVTRPPQSLRLLFIRSEFTPYGAVLKKTARVAFPIYLDMTGFTANGVWEERGQSDVQTMLKQKAANGDSSATTTIQKKIWYRLESAILHYGYTHSSGHFICIRRKPSPPSSSSAAAGTSSGAFRPATASKSCPDGCTCESCLYFGQVREAQPSIPGKGWLQISDDAVDEVGEEALYDARGAVFMLFYEKVGEYRPAHNTKEDGVGRSDQVKREEAKL